MLPTRAALFAIGLLSLAGSAGAQTTGNPQNGKALFENTRTVSGVTTITMSCTACHGDVENRRDRIATTVGLDGGIYADITTATALSRFTLATQSVAGMAQFQALSDAQKRDLAAYLGDTPETSPESESLLTFNVAAINTGSAPQTVTLTHGTTAAAALQIVDVRVDGANSTNFTTSTTCGATLLAGASCTVAVTYRPANTNLSDPELVFTLRQGGSGDFFRVLRLSGSVGAPPPADEGGGALGGAWLAALAAAVGLLARRRR